MANATGSTRNVRAWARAHPALNAAAVGVLAFLLGAGGSGSGDLEASLRAARDDARSARSDAAAAVDALEDEVSSLEADKDGLVADKLALERQIRQLNARRELPELVGSAEAFALRLEDRFGWDANVTYHYSSARPGTILSQSPAQGTMMRFGAPYTIVVAKPFPKVGDVVGMWRSGAERTLGRWDVVVVEQVSGRAPGRVLAMSPAAGSRLMPGETVTLTVAKKAPPPPPVTASSDSSSAGCTPGYSPCLPPASDYDCSGGSGDGPEYTGYVTVTGSDPYGLDADGDGAGCE
jgi:hypothetical protein